MFASSNPASQYAGYLDAANHSIGFDEDGFPVPIANFPYNSLDPETTAPNTVSIDAPASAFAEVLSWILASDNLEFASAKAAALSTLLNPTGRYRSLAAVARASGCTRSLLSKALLDLRDRFNIKQNFRGNLIRGNCSKAQHALVDEGRHASTKTKNTRDMNAQQARLKFRTLDAACSEIERLTKVTSPTPPAQTAPLTTAVKASVSKSVVAPVSKPALQLSDLTRAELLEAMDLANSEGDGEMTKVLYAEVCRRRN
jgi:hypothetical protein